MPDPGLGDRFGSAIEQGSGEARSGGTPFDIGAAMIRGFLTGFGTGTKRQKDTGITWVPKVNPVPMPQTNPMQERSPMQGMKMISGTVDPDGTKYFYYTSPDGRYMKVDGKGNIIWSRWSV